MSTFYQGVTYRSDRQALWCDGITLSYRELDEQVDAFAGQLVTGHLVMLYAGRDIPTLVTYLACLRRGCPVLLVSPTLDSEKRRSLTDCYTPNVIIEADKLTQCHDRLLSIDPRIAVLLPTSGSTGSPKFVALSADNLQANAASITAYLPIQSNDRTLANLPVCYSYGLSVINSHLLKGATVILSDAQPMQRDFWDILETQCITSLAGVPHTYQLLLRLGFTRKSLPHLRYFTQAGGKLAVDAVKALADYAQLHHKAFYVMYGQTEATARMAYLSPELAAHKPGAIGKTIPGGHFTLVDDEGRTLSGPDKQGELVYHGPNIMLGYVSSVKDMHTLQPQKSLHTGDLGYVDKDGDWYITGRVKRVTKVSGERINLDDIEHWLAGQGITAACWGNDQTLFVCGEGETDAKELSGSVARYLSIHPSLVKGLQRDTLPRTDNGKLDYPRLAQEYGV
ncbi:AMP-binding protein [Aestuariibacter halophilus]|uniref:AMP-binding protein n=1 Tax=Fluctibacter halophilus TaxID=226011 RepID=A0ABS8G3F0_9ALTE|nr:AMP-binding protein [Aestuariibacter halophilus]MCC2615112.1 AMP-binding protein [Aestuariibacter halophilus]